MLTLNLIRKTENFNENFDYRILVDGKEITRLRNGEKKSIKIDENAEFLEAKINYGLSRKISLRNIDLNQDIIVYGNRFRNQKLSYASALIPIIGLPFVLKHDYPTLKMISGILLIAYILFLIYVSFVERRKWIELQVSG